jgi:predicted MFS family arabinose efflux permease
MESFRLRLDQASSVLGVRPFRLLWAAQFTTVMAVYALNLASVTLVEEQSQSSAWTAVSILSAIIPAFLGSLVAGAVVDQRGRIPVLIGSHLGRALVALAFWLAATFSPPGLVLLIAFSSNALMTIMLQFAIPAEYALLPDLVEQRHLLSGNTLFQLGWLVAEGLGVIFIGPLVIKLAGAPGVGLMSAFLCVLALALVLALPREESQEALEQRKHMDWANLASDLREGWRAIAKDRILSLVVIQATLAATLLLVLLSLVPGLVTRHLGLGVEDAPFLILPGGVGFVLGTILLNRWEERLSKPTWIACGLTALGIGVGLLAILSGGAGGLLPVLILTLIIGLTLAFVIIPARTVFQERPPASLRGRVIAAQLALGNAAAVLPLLLGGSLADQVGILPVIGLLGLLSLGAGLLGFYQVRRSRT